MFGIEKISGRPNRFRALEPIREVWIHDERFVASRLIMIRIMARRMNAIVVRA